MRLLAAHALAFHPFLLATPAGPRVSCVQEQMNEDRQICLATYLDDMLAEVARSHLEANGIPAYVSRDDCGNMLPHMANLGGARLLVHAMHEAEARELLKQVFPEPE